MKMAYDPEAPETWPGPWEMISEGDWCPYSVAIGMEFTMRLAGISADRMEILHIRDYDISCEMFVLKIDESLVMNYSVGIVNHHYLTSRHDVLARYKSDGKRYFRLTK